MAQIRILVNTETGVIKVDASGKIEYILARELQREDFLLEINKKAALNTVAFSLIRLSNRLSNSELIVRSSLVDIDNDIYLATIIEGTRLELKTFIVESFDSIVDTLKD